jgi:signal transduction histidine kinase
LVRQVNADDLKVAIAGELTKANPDWQAIEALTKTAVETNPDKVRFTVDAGHIQRLGAELVGKQDTALSELIKNAFDADATTVKLNFSFQDKVGGTLVIEDDGSGMTDETIRESWMRISTDAKIENPVSPIYGRARAGRKGIGRFSVQRLGKSLRLETRPRGEAEGFVVNFNWDQDFNSGQDLSQIFSEIARFPKNPEDCGTKLSIFDLRDAWSEAALARVWRSVLLLQPPFPVSKADSPAAGVKADPGFSVSINGRTREQHRTAFSIEKTFLSQSLARIEASIDANGCAEFRVVSEKLDLDDYQRSTVVYDGVGPVKLAAHYFIYLPSTLSGMTQAAAAEMGRNYGGIRIYRNGFRVLPYGERSDDWLELDRDTSRRELLVPAANLNFFGQVDLATDKNPGFEETSSREGLLENDSYFQLKRFVRDGLEWAAKRIASVRNRKQTAGQRNFVPEPRRPSEAIANLLDKFVESKDDTQPSAEGSKADLEKLQKIAADYEARNDRERAEALEYQEMLRLLASLGLSISVFGHEVKGSREAVRAHLQLISKLVENIPDEIRPKKLESYVEKLGNATDRVFDVGGYIAGLMSSTESRTLRSLSVKGALEQFAEQFGEYMSKQGVDIEVDVEMPNLRTTPMHSSELDSVLLNFLTNAIKSMRLSRTEHRKVRIDGKLDGKFVMIGFEDNGGGVPQGIEDRIFDAFFTTTGQASDDGVAGPGTGLGLKIVSDIAESYGGGVGLGQPTEGYHCRIEFKVLAAGATQ